MTMIRRDRHASAAAPALPAALAAIALLLAAVPACRHIPAPAPEPESKSAPAAAAATNDEEEAYREIRLLTRALVQVRKGYVDEEKTGYRDLVYGALKGMLQSLDPHSQFMEPEAYKNMKDDTAGEFGGIGIVIGLREGALTVISPIEDSPAFRAGVLSGDKIIEIAGEKTDGVSLSDAVKTLRGEKGTRVKIKVLRPKEEKALDFDLERDIIKISSVKGARILEGGIGYVRITQFTETTADNLDTAMATLITTNELKGLVLDLRNNPGGLLSAAIQVSERFLAKGQPIVVTKGRGGAATHPPARASGSKRHLGFPMAILVNGGSASASEIVAGALQDNKRAVLVGETTFGKASVQSLLPLDDRSAIRLTTARYYTPSERAIHGVGLQPDIVVPIAPADWQKVLLKRARDENPEAFAGEKQPEDLSDVRDIQLDRAVDLLKGIAIFESHAR